MTSLAGSCEGLRRPSLSATRSRVRAFRAAARELLADRFEVAALVRGQKRAVMAIVGADRRPRSAAGSLAAMTFAGMLRGAMLRAAIFDMDGLIVDSEPLWRRTEIEVFAEVGVELTEAMCEATTGLRIDEVAHHWSARFSWKGPSPDKLAERIVDRMIEQLDPVPLPGVERGLDLCLESGLRIALASASPARLIEATLRELGLFERFEHVVSAENERFGKPHPAVFLTTADRLGVRATECLVLEDSLNGVLAAKAARARCVAVPAERERHDPRFTIADRVLSSLEELDEPLLRELAHR